MTDPVQLQEPVCIDDIRDQEEMIENVVEVQRALFDRVRFQYQQDTWISQELWVIYGYLDAAAQKMSELRSKNVFPP